MAEFVTVKLRCPVCGIEFVADEVHGASPVGRETDFRLLFDGADPLLSHLHSCPGCRYSGYRCAFETEPSDEDELIEALEDDPKSLPRPHQPLPDDEDVVDLRRYVKSGELTDGLVEPGLEPFGSVRYLLAARIYEFLDEEEDPLGSAHFYLRSAWCARAAGDRLAEKKALREVLLKLNNVLESAALLDYEKLRLCYLAGEIARRAGDFGRAVDFFAQVEKEADLDEEEGALLAALARRQSLLALMKSDINATIPPDLKRARRKTPEGGDDEEDDDVIDDDDGGDSSLN